MAFTTESCWNILIVYLVRRNQRSKSVEFSESIRAHGSATGGARLCSSIFGIFLHPNFYWAFGNEAKWCWPGLVKRHGGIVIHTWRFYMVNVYHQRWKAWWSLEWRFRRYPLSRVFLSYFSFPTPKATCDPGLGLVVCIFVLRTFFYQAYAWGRRFGFSGIYHVIIFYVLCFSLRDFPPPDSNIAFVHNIGEGVGTRSVCIRHMRMKWEGQSREQNIKLTIHVNTRMDGIPPLSNGIHSYGKHDLWDKKKHDSNNTRTFVRLVTTNLYTLHFSNAF